MTTLPNFFTNPALEALCDAVCPKRREYHPVQVNEGLNINLKGSVSLRTDWGTFEVDLYDKEMIVSCPDRTDALRLSLALSYYNPTVQGQDPGDIAFAV